MVNLPVKDSKEIAYYLIKNTQKWVVNCLKKKDVVVKDMLSYSIFVRNLKILSHGNARHHHLSFCFCYRLCMGATQQESEQA